MAVIEQMCKSHPLPNERPLIGITLGDPAGIGPEIIIGALNSPDIYKEARPLVIGETEILKRTISLIKSNTTLNLVSTPCEGKYIKGTIDLLDLENVDVSRFKLGEISREGGKASFEFIEKSVELAMNNKIDAIATAPINKESISAAGIPFVGHTEMYASLSKVTEPMTMFQVKNLRIFFLTRHVPLREACDLVTYEAVLGAIERADHALIRLGDKRRKLAVAGLNPHCGEHGLFGREEIDEIEPAVKKAKERGYNVEGPIPADSVFHQALCGRYDAVLSLYHDQGHIASKTLDFERTVSITLGLPFLRTSVDHGTAFDIAGKGIASSISMEEAIKWAARYAPHFH